MQRKIGAKDALLVVDVQKDFCPGGSLPVSAGDRVVLVLNDYLKIFERAGSQIYATRDWHPSNHMSFKAFGGKWPPHCIEGSEGAEFHSNLKLPKTTKIISKATEPSKEAYSGFDGTDLGDMLNKNGIDRVFVGGLATDYCVKNTVLDSLKMGFETILLVDATLGVNVEPDDSEKAIKEMIKRGAETVTLSDMPDLFEDIEEEGPIEEMENETLRQFEHRKNARLRTRGPYRKAHLEA